MIHVSDHACQRWIERVDPKADNDAARKAILDHRRALDAAIIMGDCKIILGSGVRLVIQDRCVVTVLPA